MGCFRCAIGVPLLIVGIASVVILVMIGGKSDGSGGAWTVKRPAPGGD